MRDGPYTIGEVARLLGLREDLRSDGERDVTFLDLLSLLEDPGGEQIQFRQALEAGDPEAWMARRGPLDPGSDEAVVLWDFLRAMRNVRPLKNSMTIGLLALGYSFAEIGAVLGRSRSSVTDQVKGTRVRDADGRPVHRWEGGPVARKPDGLVHQLTDAMNRWDLPAVRAAEEVANQKKVHWGRIEFDVVDGRVPSIVAINKRPGDTTYWEA